ncbi:MAG: hypothetical protein GY698_24485 [Actinomycetia bacterium]|nr:hypothetical protein [Actinomycetes bacterium]
MTAALLAAVAVACSPSSPAGPSDAAPSTTGPPVSSGEPVTTSMLLFSVPHEEECVDDCAPRVAFDGDIATLTRMRQSLPENPPGQYAVETIGQLSPDTMDRLQGLLDTLALPEQTTAYPCRECLTYESRLTVRRGGEPITMTWARQSADVPAPLHQIAEVMQDVLRDLTRCETSRGVERIVDCVAGDLRAKSIFGCQPEEDLCTFETAIVVGRCWRTISEPQQALLVVTGIGEQETPGEVVAQLQVPAEPDGSWTTELTLPPGAIVAGEVQVACDNGTDVAPLPFHLEIWLTASTTDS